MSAIEKVWVLAFYELRLLVRSRGKLPGLLCLPILGGVFLGLTARLTAGSASAYGLFLILPLSSLFLADANFRLGSLLSALPRGLVKPAERYTSRALAVLLVLGAQATLYTGVIALFDPGSVPGPGIIVAALALSLVVGFTNCAFSRSA